MIRMMVVYSLVDEQKFLIAADELRKTTKDIPADWKLSICKRDDPVVNPVLSGVPFGSLVQIFELPDNTGNLDFLSTEAYRAQKLRTKGLFSQTQSVFCPSEDPNQ